MKHFTPITRYCLPDGKVIHVSPAGHAYIGTFPGQHISASEAACAAIHAAAEVPFACGSEIIPAPARGPFATFTPRRTEMTPSGPRNRMDGYKGRMGMRMADAFDVMTEQAARRHPAVVAKALKDWRENPTGKEFREPPFVPPFTVGQVEVGREYAALVERCNASGVKCASLEAVRTAASGGGDREVAIFRDFQRLRVLQRRIGDGLAKEVRRVRPGKPRTKAEAALKRKLVERQRKAILAQTLVDSVCVGQMSLMEVLGAHGWGDNQRVREALRAALCAALDRMQGYGLAKPQDMA